MCGIVGVAASVSFLGDRAILSEGSDALRHRGPDGSGEWWSHDGRVGLAHRRLAIIDLSPGGCQPMAAAGRIHVTFNGEIYNFRALRDELAGKGHAFSSQSDTEVLLHAYLEWGIDCLTRLNGMFAFGLYDETEGRLLLARDRAGEKPLFYRHDAGVLRFASELKAILVDPGVPRTIDLESLDHYLAYGYVPGSHCIVAGMQKLAPGHALVYDLASDRIAIRRYWALPGPFSGPAPDVEQLVDELDTLLEDAVRLQMVADVPVGILLSGGLDSSLVTAMSARMASTPVHTFTVGFPGHRGYDETAHAQIVASHFGTRHTQLEAQPATVDLLPRLARQYDEPIADSSMVPTYLVSKLIRESATVALGGDGGDELFGGYSLYSLVLRQQQLRRHAPAFVRSLIGAVGHRLPNGVRGRHYMQSLSLDPAEAIARTGLFFDRKTRHQLVPALRGLHASPPETFRALQGAQGVTVLQKLTMADFGSYLPDDILVKVDRASMLNSLEVRAPFLDHRIISFAFGRVPDDWRATPSARKILLRRLAGRVLPPELDVTRKQGFSIPLSAWFKGEWGGYMEDVMLNADQPTFDRRAVAKLVAGQRRGLANSQRLFAITMFELWRREYGMEMPG